jgi:ABC-type branched-subunit amino acid transport system substrate-binding protein
MEQLTKRILAIVLIAVVGVGVGITVWIFVAPYSWGAKDVPGMENVTTITEDQIIKFGVLGDIGEIQGDGAWEGAYMAAKEINLAGGITIAGKQYYIGVTKEDTDESNPQYVTARGVAAAERIINYKNVQFATGGFRTEMLSAYLENFMTAKIPFIGTGAATDSFCENVHNDYAKYKYWFRCMPTNSSSLGKEILYYLGGQILALNASYPLEEVRTVGILAENLDWAPPLVEAVQQSLPLVVAGLAIAVYHVDPAVAVSWVTNTSIIANTIYYDINLEAGDMYNHLVTLETAGCDIVVPVISAQGGILMMQQYADLHPDYLLIGIDVQSQLDTYWDLTGGDCVYETMLQAVYNVSKTSLTKAMFTNYHNEFGHDPLYTAVGSYDAIYAYAWAINETQSFNSDDIVVQLETVDKAHPLEGASGQLAFTGTHDVFEGYPYGYTLFCQWQPGEVKAVVPDYYLYSPYLDIEGGTYLVAPWVNTAWSP